LAAGTLRVPGQQQAASPLIKAVVDGASEGTLVTDARGRIIYANAAYLALTDTTATGDVRPVERVFIGDPSVSEAVYRLLKAAREGRRLQEEVRVSARQEEPGRWLRMRVRSLGDSKREARLTVWTIADVTRELERQENVFQELQHAIDYLDHAPAGAQPRARRRPTSTARRRSALHELFPQHPDGARDRRPRGPDRALERAVRAAVQSGAQRRGWRQPVGPRGRCRARPAWARSRHPQGRARPGRDRPGRR